MKTSHPKLALNHQPEKLAFKLVDVEARVGDKLRVNLPGINLWTNDDTPPELYFCDLEKCGGNIPILEHDTSNRVKEESDLVPWVISLATPLPSIKLPNEEGGVFPVNLNSILLEITKETIILTSDTQTAFELIGYEPDEDDDDDNDGDVLEPVPDEPVTAETVKQTEEATNHEPVLV